MQPLSAAALTMRTQLSRLAEPVAFFGQVLLAVLDLVRGAATFRGRDLARVAAKTTLFALPIVTIVNLLVGAILAFVGAVQLVKFGAGIYVADLVAIAAVREMAAVITAVVMAGRTGAAFAAELATMQANEEVDAITVLGLDPAAYLVVPRVLALTLAMPLLYLYACAASLIGGLVVGASILDLSPAAYLERSVDALSYTQFALGLAKSLTFGALVAVTGCYCGLTARRNAAGVGEATTGAVVTSIVGVIVLDAVFAVLANALNL